MNDISRRDLLKYAAGGSAAIAAGPLLAACGTTSSTGAEGGNPVSGGILRVGVTGGSSSDTFDPHLAVTVPDFARAELLFEGLVGTDSAGRPKLLLAEELAVNKPATEWTIRVHKGIQFHNGKELTGDDVIYTLRRIANPTEPLVGALSLERLDLANAKKLDKYTVRIPTKQPFAILEQVLYGGQIGGAANFVVVPVGFDPKNPVGTGPFKYQSFTPNVQTKVVKNQNYWHKNRPYLDGVTLTGYADEASQVNALVAGQEDAVNALSIGSVASVEAGGKVAVITESGGWVPIVMRTNADPFSDAAVRQAMRLIVDRKQMIDQVFGGHGIIGNDVFSYFSEDYDRSLPQREQDLEQAKSLLKAAGQDGLAVELVTAPIAQGAIQVAEVFAQQASNAGVKVSLKKTSPTELYGSKWLQWPFTQDLWFSTSYLPEVALATYSKAPFNETHFNNPRYDSLFQDAISTTDKAKRRQLAQDMQRIDYEEGGYIVPFFAPVIDGIGNNVNGLMPSRSGLPLHDFNFTDVWVS